MLLSVFKGVRGNRGEELLNGDVGDTLVSTFRWPLKDVDPSDGEEGSAFP